MKFELHHTSSGYSARAGTITTVHGQIPTPVFMPVGTAAAVKGIYHRDLSREAGASIILANTYHLYLRPGMDVIRQAGGRACKLALAQREIIVLQLFVIRRMRRTHVN